MCSCFRSVLDMNKNDFGIFSFIIRKYGHGKSKGSTYYEYENLNVCCDFERLNEFEDKLGINSLCRGLDRVILLIPEM